MDVKRAERCNGFLCVYKSIKAINESIYSDDTECIAARLKLNIDFFALHASKKQVAVAIMVKNVLLLSSQGNENSTRLYRHAPMLEWHRFNAGNA